MEHMINTVKAFAHDEEGATAIEYGLLASLIAVVIIASVTALGTKLDGVLTTIKNAFV